MNDSKKENSELNERVRAFNEKLIALLGEFKLGLGAVSFIMPDGRVGARPQVFDDSKPKTAQTQPENKPTDNSQADAPAAPDAPKVDGVPVPNPTAAPAAGIASA